MSSPTKYQIVVLILTYQRPSSLKKLLNSLIVQEFSGVVEKHVFIWNNDPSGSSGFEMQDELQRSDWIPHYQVSETNLKMRAKRSLEDWCFSELKNVSAIVHLDDDVLLMEGWIESCMEVLEEGFDACGSIELYEDRWVCSGQIELNLDIADNGVKFWQWEWQDFSEANAFVPAKFAGHRAIMVKGDIAQRARHDPDIKIGGEDLDYSLEINKHGGKIAISGGARIHHREDGQQDAKNFRNKEDVLKSWERFYSKWGFVRLNAASEANLNETQWLNLFKTDADNHEEIK